VGARPFSTWVARRSGWGAQSLAVDGARASCSVPPRRPTRTRLARAAGLWRGAFLCDLAARHRGVRRVGGQRGAGAPCRRRPRAAAFALLCANADASHDGGGAPSTQRNGLVALDPTRRGPASARRLKIWRRALSRPRRRARRRGPASSQLCCATSSRCRPTPRRAPSSNRSATAGDRPGTRRRSRDPKPRRPACPGKTISPATASQGAAGRRRGACADADNRRPVWRRPRDGGGAGFRPFCDRRPSSRRSGLRPVHRTGPLDDAQAQDTARPSAKRQSCCPSRSTRRAAPDDQAFARLLTHDLTGHLARLRRTCASSSDRTADLYADRQVDVAAVGAEARRRLCGRRPRSADRRRAGAPPRATGRHRHRG